MPRDSAATCMYNIYITFTFYFYFTLFYSCFGIPTKSNLS